MFKKVLLSLIAILVVASSAAYFRYYEREHLHFSPAEIKLKWSAASPDISKLQTGDLIFRHGRGAISNCLMEMNLSDKKYSHSGIIHIENGNVSVYHAIGGEENVSNKLQKDSLERFCNASDIHSFGIYRLDLTPEQKEEEDSLAASYYNSGLEFDLDFYLATDDKMYCTEFVYKIINKVTDIQNYLPLSTFSGKTFIACDNLYLNEHSQLIYSYNY